MKKTNFTNLGGLKFTQTRLAYLQDSFVEPLECVAKLCGNKTIVCGVEVNGSNVSDGWIVYNNELLQFIGGTLGAQVVVSTVINTLEYGNGETQPVHYDKRATCGAVGDFAFNELVRLSSLQNIWQPGDLKMKYVSTAYIEAHFDANGYGTDNELGWRILSAAYPNTAGKAFVNLDASDVKFNEPGKVFGTQSQGLTAAQLPPFRVKLFASVEGVVGSDNLNGFPNRAPAVQTTDTNNRSYTMVSSASTQEATVGSSSQVGAGETHNNIQPSLAVLTLIRL
jgi:microcystin-dependent protein